MAEKCDAVLSKSFRPEEPGIAVIAALRGDIVFRKGYGMANLELGIPIRPDMVFRIGSVTKTFTALAVMMLAERGLLSLDDEVSRYLPEYPMHSERITVRHLLAHTSGIPDLLHMKEYYELMSKECFRLMNDEVDVSEFLKLFKDRELEFEPGEKCSYSNSGYFLLGQIIEAVSGEKYQAFLKENIFEPLGMNNTRYYGNIDIIRNRALDYLQDDDGGFINNPYESLAGSLVYAAGGLMSTVDDLAKLDAALYTEKLITRESLELMSAANKLNSGEITKNGLGWELRQLKGKAAFMHGGDVYGYSAVMLRMPEQHIFVALVGNDDRIHSIFLEYFADKIAAILMGDPFPEWQAISLPPDSLAKYAGSYEIDEQNVRTVIVEGPRIFTQRNDGPRMEIFPAEHGIFFYEMLLNYITFEADGGGVVQKMIMHYENGRESSAKKVR